MIRTLTAADRTLFLNMAQEFYASDAVAHPVPSTYHERTFEELMGPSPYASGYMLEWEGHPAGYALTATTFSQEAGGLVLWIEEIYVLPAYRSHGLGRELLTYIETHRDPRVTRLRLEVEPDNAGAIRLYHARGFTALPYTQMVKELPRG